MKKFFYLLTLLLSFHTMQAQEKGFVIHGQVNLPDGYSVGIVCQTDTNFSVSIADSHIKDGQFVLKGKHLESPAKGTLMTNNLELVEKNHWPTDSIRWTYNEIFLSDGNLTFTPDFRLIGTQVQSDYNDLLDMGGEMQADGFAFIDKHPQSVVSLYLANRLLQRGYNLTDEQVAHLEKTIQPQGVDAVREKEYAKRIRAAKFTTKGSGVADLDLLDVNGKRCQLAGVVPRGKYVLIDFWASWCGMCLHAMPEVAEIAKDFNDIFCVIVCPSTRKMPPGARRWRNIPSLGRSISPPSKAIRTSSTNTRWATACLTICLWLPTARSSPRPSILLMCVST